MLRLQASFLIRFLALALILILAIAVLPAQAQADFPCSDLASQTNGDLTVDLGSGGLASSGVNGIVGDVFCRVIVRDTGVNTSLSEIGVSSLINQPIVQAVNIYGMAQGTSLPFLPDTLVCLRGQGTLYELSVFDKTGTPSEVSAFPTDRVGYTCSYMSFAGTLVLVGTLDTTVTPPTPAAASGDLLGCLITTRATLHLRSFPSTTSVILASIPTRTQLAATAHSAGWYQVNYQALQGWVSDRYVILGDNCG